MQKQNNSLYHFRVKQQIRQIYDSFSLYYKQFASNVQYSYQMNQLEAQKKYVLYHYPIVITQEVSPLFFQIERDVRLLFHNPLPYLWYLLYR